MEYKSENKICQNCKINFTVESEDFSFYEKIKVPPPTFCPECRSIRRMCWRNERSLFKRKCDKTGKDIIAMFSPEDSFVVHDRDIWWGDSWDSSDFGLEYDFSKPFFEQFKELLSRVPLASLGNTNVINSPYGNHNADCKDCYLTYASWKGERVSYSQGALESKDCLDVYTLDKSELCYEDVLCGKCYKVNYSYNSDECVEASFLWNCKNVQDSIGCINLINMSHCIFNKQYSKEEYNKFKSELDLSSYKNFQNFEKEFNKFKLSFPNKYANIIKSINVTGDNIMNSKNIQNCFDVYGNVEDSKYVTHVIDLKDGYDGYGVGAGASLLYEGVDSGIKASNQLFSVLTHSCFNTQYTYMCYNSKNLFGCIGIRKGEHYILNKKYSKEEYESIMPKILKHMNDMPYVDKSGSVYSYGEFFPNEISPFAYNETIAQEYYPKTRKEIEDFGYRYRVRQARDYVPTIDSKELPDHIKDVVDEVVNEIIVCSNKGNELTQCTEVYRVTKTELDFLRQNNIPLPRFCPNCRHYKRLNKRNPLKLWTRNCMKQGCANKFETSYAPDRPEIVYCEKCYQQEVY